MADLVITGIPVRDVPLVWNQVEPLINKALERGRGELWACDVLDLLLSGDMQLWAAFDGTAVAAVCTSVIVRHKRQTVCQLNHAAGERMAEWQWFLAVIEEWAKAQGCQQIHAYGRRGWARALGWEEVYTVAAKRL